MVSASPETIWFARSVTTRNAWIAAIAAPAIAATAMASESEPGARNQYRATLEALAGKDATAELLAHEIRTFPGRLGIQHRDVPYAVLNDIADGGIIFSHLAAFYAHTYPDRLRAVAVPDAERFGQELALARTERGFANQSKFQYGAELNLRDK